MDGGGLYPYALWYGDAIGGGDGLWVLFKVPYKQRYINEVFYYQNI